MVDFSLQLNRSGKSRRVSEVKQSVYSFMRTGDRTESLESRRHQSFGTLRCWFKMPKYFLSVLLKEMNQSFSADASPEEVLLRRLHSRSRMVKKWFLNGLEELLPMILFPSSIEREMSSA